MAVLALAAAAESSDDLDFTVLRDGQPIGWHSVRLMSEADGFRAEVQTEIAVAIAFIPLFHYRHERSELWRHGHLISLQGQTDDNGRHFDLSIEAGRAGYRRIVNGRQEDFGPEVEAGVPWRALGVGRHHFLSAVDDRLFDVSIEPLGADILELSSGAVKGDRFRMTGDAERELWYDRNGRLLRMRFRRFGSWIDFLRR